MQKVNPCPNLTVLLADKKVVWAATTRNLDYIKMVGLRKAVKESAYRKEIVAGNMWEYMYSGKLQVSMYSRC